MKLFFTAFLLNLFTVSSFAASSKDFKDFKYVFPKQTEKAGHFSEQGFNLMQKGFSRVALQSPVSVSPLTLMDEMWISQDSSQAVFIKHHLKTEGKIKFGEFYPVKHGVAIHEQIQGRVRLTYFHGFNQKNARKFMSPRRCLDKASKASPFSIISSAHADELCLDLIDNSAFTFAVDISKAALFFINPLSAVASGGGSCLPGLLNGMWDATGGTVADIATAAWGLVTSPVKTLNGIGESYNALKYMLLNFRQVMGEAGDYFDKLPSSQKTKIFCQVVGTLGTGVAVTLLTAGAATPALIAAIITTVQTINTTFKSTKLLKLASGLEKQYAKSVKELANLKENTSHTALKEKLEIYEKKRLLVHGPAKEYVDFLENMNAPKSYMSQNIDEGIKALNEVPLMKIPSKMNRSGLEDVSAKNGRFKLGIDHLKFMELSPAQTKELQEINLILNRVSSLTRNAESGISAHGKQARDLMLQNDSRINNFIKSVSDSPKKIKPELEKMAMSDEQFSMMAGRRQNAVQMAIKEASKAKEEVNLVLKAKAKITKDKIKLAAYYGVVLATNDIELENAQ